MCVCLCMCVCVCVGVFAVFGFGLLGQHIQQKPWPIICRLSPWLYSATVCVSVCARVCVCAGIFFFTILLTLALPFFLLLFFHLLPLSLPALTSCLIFNVPTWQLKRNYPYSNRAGQRDSRSYIYKPTQLALDRAINCS